MGSLATNYLFARLQYDSATGLYSMRARYYDPGVGRFLSRDTWAINYANPVELNRYVYAANNPVRWSDPSGHFSFAEFKLLVQRVAVPAIASLTYLANRVQLWIYRILQALGQEHPINCFIFEFATDLNLPNCGANFESGSRLPFGGSGGGDGDGGGGQHPPPPIVQNERTLFVGEETLSFAASVASQAEHPELVTATILQDSSQLSPERQAAYIANRDIIIGDNLHGRVMDRVNATALQTHQILMYEQFDTIVFHFPHTSGDVPSNRLLLRQFFESTSEVLAPSGRVQVALSGNPFYNRFAIVAQAEPFFPIRSYVTIDWGTYQSMYPNYVHHTTVTGVAPADITSVRVWTFSR